MRRVWVFCKTIAVIIVLYFSFFIVKEVVRTWEMPDPMHTATTQPPIGAAVGTTVAPQPTTPATVDVQAQLYPQLVHVGEETDFRLYVKNTGPAIDDLTLTIKGLDLVTINDVLPDNTDTYAPAIQDQIGSYDLGSLGAGKKQGFYVEMAARATGNSQVELVLSDDTGATLYDATEPLAVDPAATQN